jgi:hypothetical protein
MNIRRRIKLLSAAGALSLMSLVGLIAAAPAQARTIAPDRPTATSYHTNYTWWLPAVFLTPFGFDCTSGTFAGYSADFLGDTSVNVTEIDEQQTTGQWQALSFDSNNPDAAVISVNRWTGSIITSPPQSVWWGSLPYGEFGTGRYEAWLQDSSFRGGAVFFTCP